MRKILSLILTISMLATMAFATMPTFTDAETIKYSEAVDVLSAISVINGYTDGSFKPTGEVTRAEMAKMISVMLNKGEDVGPLYVGACTFADAATHWAAGYIAYCAQEKIINGRNAAIFDPDANVTGVEAAKMLLCALGYDPAVESLTGPTWAANTLSLAKKCELKARTAGGSVNEDVNFNLLSNLGSLVMNAPLTREAAAQLILNAMLCTKVDYDGNAQTITIGNTSFTTGATLLSLRSSIYNDYHTLPGAKRLTKTITTGDDFGRPATMWTLGGESIGSYSTTPAAQYVNIVTGGQVYTDLGKPQFGVGEGRYELKVFVDGIYQGNQNEINIVSGNTVNVTPMGSTTEIYVDDETMTITMVIINNYIAQVSGVYGPRVDFNGDVTREAYITLKTVNNKHYPPTGEVEFADGTRASQAFITDGYTLADRNVTYVVYTKANNKIQSVTRAVVKTGMAGGLMMDVEQNPLAFALDSVSYPVAKTATAFTADYGSNATIYLDTNGTILHTEATASSTIAFVLAAGQETDGIYGGVTTGANLLFTDGTTKKVNVYNQNGMKYPAGIAAMKNTIVSYTINANGEYVLMPMYNATVNTYGYTNTITSVMTNNPNLPGSAMFANDNTTFIVETSTTDSTGAVVYNYTTYTGLKNVPTVEQAAVIAGVNSRTAPTTASYVFVVGGQIKDTSAASVSVFMKNIVTDGASTDMNNNTYFTTKAVVDGEIKTVKMTQGAYESLDKDLTKGLLQAYTNMTLDTNGYITGLTQAASMKEYVKDYIGFNGIDGLYNNGVITMIKDDNTTESFSVNSVTPVYVFDKIANTVTRTTVDAFNTNYKYHKTIVVLSSADKILNNNEIVTAIYVEIGM